MQLTFLSIYLLTALLKSMYTKDIGIAWENMGTRDGGGISLT